MQQVHREKTLHKDRAWGRGGGLLSWKFQSLFKSLWVFCLFGFVLVSEVSSFPDLGLVSLEKDRMVDWSITRPDQIHQAGESQGIPGRPLV